MELLDENSMADRDLNWTPRMRVLYFSGLRMLQCFALQSETCLFDWTPSRREESGYLVSWNFCVTFRAGIGKDDFFMLNDFNSACSIITF